MQLIVDRCKEIEVLCDVLRCAIQCMAHGWMCILTGGPASGKTALARTTAALAGRPLVELTLTGGTDTSDLLGSFEQQEPARQLQVSLDAQFSIPTVVLPMRPGKTSSGCACKSVL